MNKNKKSVNFDINAAKKYTEEISNNYINKTYFVKTYGCQLNENDSEKISGMLEFMNFQPSDDIETADIIILNTCTIRENANDKIFGNLGIVNHIKRNNPEKIVAVCGCMMKEDHNVETILKKFKFVDIIFGPGDIHEFPQMLADYVSSGKNISKVGNEDIVAQGVPVKHKKKFRALTTIIYGCNNFCTYCIVPYVRGRERSRDVKDILDELKLLGDQGYKEVMLLGQNVNSFGNEKRDDDFADLLRKACEVKKIKRIRFMTSHPKDISKKLIDLMSEMPQIMPHIHLPLQSGSDRILKLMNRGYTTAQYYNTIKYAREKIPDISITTDIIVGFPGETEEDFIETLTFMGKVCFDSAFTFQYSKRTGTPASEFEDQVSEPVIKRRFDKLLELQNSCSFASNQSVVNTFQDVLIEGVSEKDKTMLTGRTPHNRLINFSYDTNNIKIPDSNMSSDFEGILAKVKVNHAKTFSLEGELVDWV